MTLAKRLQAKFQQALTLHKSNRLIEAENLYRLLVSATKDSEVYRLYGTCLFQLEKPTDALFYLEKSLKINSNVFEAQMLKALCLKILNRELEAIPLYKQLIMRAPNTTKKYECLINLGSCLYATYHLEEAEVYIQQALLLDPKRYEGNMNMGLCLKHKDPHKARQYFATALTEKPDCYNSLANDALIALALGKWDIGWENYEYRWITMGSVYHGVKGPHWNGQDLTDKTIFVHFEQGLSLIHI